MKINSKKVDKIKLSFLDKENNELESWYITPVSFGYNVRRFMVTSDGDLMDIDIEGLVLYGEEKAN